MECYMRYYDVDKWDVIGDRDSVDSRIPINWPNRLANLLNVELIDESRGGGSTLRAIRMCIEYINNNIDTIDDTLFIIETTSGYRDEIYSNKLDRLFNLTISNCTDEKDITDNPTDRKKIKDELESYFKHFVNDNNHYKKESKEILGFISLLKQLGCEFFIVNQAVNSHMQKYHNSLYNKLNVKERIIDWEGGDCIVQWYWKEKKISIGDDLEKYVGDTDYHPGYFGHIKIAEHIHKELKKYYGKI